MSLAGIGLACGASLPWVLQVPLGAAGRPAGKPAAVDPDLPRACSRSTTAVLAGADPGAARRAARGAPAAVRHALRDPGHRDRRLHHRDHARARAGRGQLGADRRVPERELRRAARCWSGWRRATAGAPPSWRAPSLLGALAAGDAGSSPHRGARPRTRRRSASRSARCSRRPGIWAVVLFALLFKLDISAMEPMTRPFWVASGFSLDQIAALTTGRLLATLAGAALGGHHRDAGGHLPRAVVARAGAAAVESGLRGGGGRERRQDRRSPPRRCSRTSPPDWARRRSSRS